MTKCESLIYPKVDSKNIYCCFCGPLWTGMEKRHFAVSQWLHTGKQTTSSTIASTADTTWLHQYTVILPRLNLSSLHRPNRVARLNHHPCIFQVLRWYHFRSPCQVDIVSYCFSRQRQTKPICPFPP